MITYTYTVSNTGEVTLTGIMVTDSMLGKHHPERHLPWPRRFHHRHSHLHRNPGRHRLGANIVNTATVTCDQGVTASASATVSIEEVRLRW
jgi:hypothetical protein